MVGAASDETYNSPHAFTVHLTAKELAGLDQLADRLHMNRSEVIRYVITHLKPVA
ncbi:MULTISPECIES: ribbon-helix-helix domain-containing protein [Corynebacterium]|uniref:ribbon-helix-helix domain-containing protein n=1 Tax=Corynebacterium TaxID=1716 RepID=UPI00195B5957|nr:CopG family transcriptional regulator [Corynebacterium kroppenstedtii]